MSFVAALAASEIMKNASAGKKDSPTPIPEIPQRGQVPSAASAPQSSGGGGDFAGSLISAMGKPKAPVSTQNPGTAMPLPVTGGAGAPQPQSYAAKAAANAPMTQPALTPEQLQQLAMQTLGN